MVCLSANSCPELSLPREAPFLDILIVQTRA
ncbi:BnaC06g07250D [Brassica napus]|uniref:BnaC06g07250D protein n=1 Tax=Brassica napus TaxID=3708 RepID=A0A078H6D2_BRANA|nr:BnaC06g07250D [Brassica napus]